MDNVSQGESAELCAVVKSVSALFLFSTCSPSNALGIRSEGEVLFLLSALFTPVPAPITCYL